MNRARWSAAVVGLAALLEAGAGCIIVTGLAADERKLALARRFGAHHTIDVETENPFRRVREITDGRMADVVDVTAYALEAVTQAVDLARRGGTIVLGGTKGFKPVPNFVSDKIVITFSWAFRWRRLTIAFPRVTRPACGSSWTLIQWILPASVKKRMKS